MNTPYSTLCQRFEKISTLGEIESVLFWDNAVVMPQEGADARSRQVALIPSLQHQIYNLPDMEELFEKATQDNLVQENVLHATNLKLMKREWTLETLIPEKLVSAISALSVKTERMWRELPHNTLSTQQHKEFLNLFSALFDAVFERASIIAEKFHITPYDAMLDAFEPGMQLQNLNPLFENLEIELPSIAHAAMKLHAENPNRFSLSVEVQKSVSEILAQSVGFQNINGRLDESAHPFSSGNHGDQRITVRYNPENPLEAFMATLHECGHALYEKGLPHNFLLMPVGKARGMALHESQSLLVENHIGRSQEYLQFIADTLKPHRSTSSLNALTQQCRHVKTDYIRVTSDEVTYPSHILLRFSIEKQLFAKKISPKDIEEVWNLELKSRLNLPSPPHPKKGWLQDVHWVEGLFGYFPHYLVGAMAAAQLFNTLSSNLPNIKQQLAQGQTQPVQDWLRTHVHQKGALLDTPTLIQNITGKSLSSEDFILHLRSRYTSPS